jgi:membrane protein YqaA with SNARE-associated domain
MRLFSALYDRVFKWSAHRHAPWYLAGLSFVEASVFPIPPDVILAPMTISKPKFAWRYAALTTSCSVLGGAIGYALGSFFMGLIEPTMFKLGYAVAYHKVQHWFLTWGVLTLLFAGFTPIPYKIFTLASGAVGLPFLPFMLASVVGRGSRFFLVATLMRLGGEKMFNHLRVYIDWLGWIFLIAIMALLIIYHYR